jgi:hypothetical protein
MNDDGPLKSKYGKLEQNRNPFLTRARRAAELTLPYLVPKDGATGSSEYPTPYQSLGARGVSNLAAKLLLAILPAGNVFFKLDIDKFTRAEMAGDDVAEGKFTKALSDVEKAVMLYIEASPIRVSVYEALKHLIVGGNALIHLPDNKEKTADMRVYPLAKYVVKRSPVGQILEIITKESVSAAALSPDIVKVCGIKGEDDKKSHDLYTQIIWSASKNKWFVRQELNGVTVPDSHGHYPKDKLPWFALRLHKIDGEDYGRGLVEEYLGDLVSLESLMKSIVKGSAAAAKVVFFNRPNGVTKSRDVTAAESGDFITGDSNDISTLQLDKFNDFRVALETIGRLEDRLTTAFMLRESVQRDAERVTAEEIKFMAAELDDALGGVYSILSQELQLPLVTRVMLDMERKNILPNMPKDIVTPVITTGLDALGRTQELVKLDALVNNLFQLDPQLANKYVDISEYIRRRGVALSVDTDGLIRSAEDVAASDAQAKQEAMAQEAMSKGVGPAVKAMGDNINQQQ